MYNEYAIAGFTKNDHVAVCVVSAQCVKEAVDIATKYGPMRSILALFLVEEPELQVDTEVVIGVSDIPSIAKLSYKSLESYIDTIEYDYMESHHVEPKNESDNIDKLKKELEIVAGSDTGVQDIHELIYHAAMVAIFKHRSDKITSPDDVFKWRRLNVINDIFHLD